MSVSDIRRAVASLVSGAQALVVKPSQAGYDDLARQAAVISERRGEDFHTAAEKFRQGRIQEAEIALNVAVENAARWERSL
jgi:hypothetical protein